MKKILFAAAALVAMASCATDDVVSRPADEAIDFAEAFVENSTRANDINKDNLSQFNVYGSVNANGTNGFIFEDKLVEKNGDVYTYSPAQYWIPAADYKFTAFASLTSTQTVDRQWSFAEGANAANGVISFNNAAAEANQDLVYAYAERTTDATISSKPHPVAFTFNHMLSRVKFTITNGFTDGSNIELDITNLTITDAHANGTLAVVDGETQTWAVGTETFSRNFGSTEKLADNNTSWPTEHFYLIPTKATYNVTFDVTLWQAGVEVDTYTRTATVTLDMEKGKSYNINATLNTSNTSDDGSEIYPIEFTVADVEDWEDFGNVDAEVTKVVVATAENFAEAVADPAVGEIILAEDIELNGSLVFGAPQTRAGETSLYGRDFVIDGNGKTLKVMQKGTGRAIDFTKETNGANLTLKNLTIENHVSWIERIVNYNTTGVLTLDNVKIVNAEGVKSAFNYAVNLPAYSDGAKVVINNSEIWSDATTLNLYGENTLVNITNSKLYVTDNTAAEGHTVVSLGNDGQNAAHNSVINVEGGEIKVVYYGEGETMPSSALRDATVGSQINISESTDVDGDIKLPVANVVYDDGSYMFYSFATLQAAIDKVQADNKGTVQLIKDVTVEKIDLTKSDKDIVIDAAGHTITTSYCYGVEISAGKNVTLKNAKVVMTVAGNYMTYAAGIKINNGDYTGKTVKFENCEVRMINPDWAYAVNMPASVKGLNLVLDKCTLEGAIALQCWGDNNTITVTNSELICNYTTSELYTSACVALQNDGSYAAENNTVSVSNSAFSYSGVDNYNSPIWAVKDYNGENTTNTISVTNCTYTGVVEI